MPAVNTLVGGSAETYTEQAAGGYDSGSIGSAASYISGDHTNGDSTHLSLAAMFAVAIGALVLLQVSGFRGMIAVGR